MELQGKRALVTGGAVRLGRAFSLALAGAGCDVCVHFRGSERGAAEVVEAIAGAGGRGISVRADLERPEECARLVAEARRGLGGLDILVNNAASFEPGGLLDTSASSWDRQLALNLRAPFLLCRTFVAALPEGARGSIVNVADARVRRPGSGHLAYRVAKAALAHLGELLALELAPRVTVNTLAPGAMLPAAGEDSEPLKRRAAEAIPLRRAGGVEPATAGLLFLLREDFVTGVLLPVDGGEYL